MKNPAPLSPSRLDVAALAERGLTLTGSLELSALERLSDPDSPPPDPAGRIDWSARGEQRAMRVGPAQIRLHLQATAAVDRTCQRCLQPVRLDLAVDRSFIFAPSEKEAEAWDAESEDDVLALTRSLNLHELIEDELLLALPLVPRHDACPPAQEAALQAVLAQAPLPASDGGAPDQPEGASKVTPARENPFAVLAALKRSPPEGQGGA